MDIKNVLKVESRDTLIYLSSTFITGLGAFLVVPFFWSKLTPTDFGIIAIAELISAFCAVFLGLSLDAGLTRYFYVWSEEERGSKMFTIWVFGWLVSIVLSLALFALLYFLSNYISFSIAFFPFVFFGILQSLFASFGNIPFASMRIMKLPQLYLKSKIAVFVLTLGLQLYFVLFLNEGLLGYFYATIISGGINTLLLIWIMRKISTPKLCLNILPEQLKYSLPLIPSNIFGYFSAYIDRILLQQYSNLTTLGIYSVSMKFAGLISQLHGAIKLSYVPFLFQALEEKSKHTIITIEKIKEVYIFALFFVGLCICLLISEYVYLTNQPSYLPTISIVPYLVFISIISSLYLYYAPGILLSKKTGYLIIPNLLQVLVFVIVGFFTISLFQLYGIIASKFASAVIYLISSIFLSSYLSRWTNQYRPLFIYASYFVFAIFFKIWFIEGPLIYRMLMEGILLLLFAALFVVNSKILDLRKLLFRG